jgi:bifunctional non-homologous end joining protein LigD
MLVQHGLDEYAGQKFEITWQAGTLSNRAGVCMRARNRKKRVFCIGQGFRHNACWSARAMDSSIEVQGKQLKLSNLEKVLYPAAGFTKQQVIDYYVRIAPAMVPHLAERPLTRKRYPNGVDEEFFYEKNAPQHRPDWVKTVPIWSGRNRRTVHYILADDLATLVWLANLAAIELHPSLSLAKDITCPTMMVFDLDPGPPANIVQCCQVGLWLREIFEHFGLKSFPKTSGSKGLQIYVPLNTPTNYESTKTFSHALAQLLEHEHPELVVSDMKKQVRAGKVFVDWSQNDEHKTTVAVYSLRARERPTVSTPLTWEEVERGFKKKDASLLVFEAKQVVVRVEKMGDLFAPVEELKQRLPDLKSVAASAAAEAQPTISIAAQADEEEEPRKPAHRAAKKAGKPPRTRKPQRKV